MKMGNVIVWALVSLAVVGVLTPSVSADRADEYNFRVSVADTHSSNHDLRIDVCTFYFEGAGDCIEPGQGQETPLLFIRYFNETTHRWDRVPGNTNGYYDMVNSGDNIHFSYTIPKENLTTWESGNYSVAVGNRIYHSIGNTYDITRMEEFTLTHNFEVEGMGVSEMFHFLLFAGIAGIALYHWWIGTGVFATLGATEALLTTGLPIGFKGSALLVLIALWVDAMPLQGLRERMRGGASA